mgnify:CR=1 FL=1
MDLDRGVEPFDGLLAPVGCGHEPFGLAPYAVGQKYLVRTGKRLQAGGLVHRVPDDFDRGVGLVRDHRVAPGDPSTKAGCNSKAGFERRGIRT